VSLAIARDAATLAEGKRLFVARNCPECHGIDLAGAAIVDDPKVGRIIGANLTRGKGGVGGARGSEDLVRALRYGIAPSGRPLLIMPALLNRLSDTETAALVAYIQSAPAVDQANPENWLGLPIKALGLVGKVPVFYAERIDFRAARAPDVPVGATVAFGEHLSRGCGCHGPAFSGGPNPGTPADWPQPGNLTPDPVTGLGAWSERDFMRSIREGQRPDGTALRRPMPWQNLREMTDIELRALWLYLRSLPAKPLGQH
jgi:mono/diheme cytochrome c family protein